jgi:hypothetical protein
VRRSRSQSFLPHSSFFTTECRENELWQDRLVRSPTKLDNSRTTFRIVTGSVKMQAIFLSRGTLLKVAVLFFSLASAVLSCGVAALAAEGPPSAFLPAPGQTTLYRFSDLLKTPNGDKSLAGTLTLTMLSPDEVRATIAMEGKESRSFELHVDETGALQLVPGSEPAAQADGAESLRKGGLSEPSAAEEQLIRRLSLVARICAHPGKETSFPVLLDVPWASGPVDPLLSVQMTAPETFIADANEATTINPPSKGRPHILRSVLISVGIGVAASQIGGIPGRVVGPVVSIGSLVIASRARAGALPTDVRLHSAGSFSEGRLQTISGTQEYAVHAGKHSRTFSDTWSLVLESGAA